MVLHGDADGGGTPPPGAGAGVGVGGGGAGPVLLRLSTCSELDGSFTVVTAARPPGAAALSAAAPPSPGAAATPADPRAQSPGRSDGEAAPAALQSQLPQSLLTADGVHGVGAAAHGGAAAAPAPAAAGAAAVAGAAAPEPLLATSGGEWLLTQPPPAAASPPRGPASPGLADYRAALYAPAAQGDALSGAAAALGRA
eukprot:gene43008-35930_t